MSFLISNVFNGITGILVAIAPNYVSLLVFRTLYGLGVKGGWMAGYVLGTGASRRTPASPQPFHSCWNSSSVTEIVGVEFRRTVGILYQMFFSIGILILPLLAYYITDWRWLQVAFTLPYFLFLSYYWWGRPYWLASDGWRCPSGRTLWWQRDCSVYLQVHPRVSQMASVSQQEVQSREDHGEDGQREQDDAVEEHRGERWFINSCMLAGNVWTSCWTSLNYVPEVQEKMSHKAYTLLNHQGPFQKRVYSTRNLCRNSGLPNSEMSISEFSVSEHVFRIGLVISELKLSRVTLSNLKSLLMECRYCLSPWQHMKKKTLIVPLLPVGDGRFNDPSTEKERERQKEERNICSWVFPSFPQSTN